MILRRIPWGVVLLIVVTAGAAAVEPPSREACEAAGGQWGRLGLQPQARCNLPAPDAGKPCTDATDCAGACIAPPSAPVDSRAQGTCSPRMLLLGTCLKQVLGGVVTPPLCVD